MPEEITQSVRARDKVINISKSKYISLGGKYTLRKFKSPDEIIEKAEGYFKEINDKIGYKVDKEGNEKSLTESFNAPYTLAGLCNHLGTTTSTFIRYATDKDRSEFHGVCNILLQKIEERLVTGALTNEYNARMAECVLKNQHEYVDKKINESTVQHDINFTIIVPSTIEEAQMINNEDEEDAIDVDGVECNA